ncbi:MAG: hypothetical protein JNN07_13575 [Verrucomicrobiales bacterium]|nr:hypothetical protein [Verrucomicrobiales bacterium]
MKEDIGIKLQAYVDGELSGGERLALEKLLAEDASLQALRQELVMVKEALREADPVVSVPASREFYWSQIERRLERVEAQNEVAAVSGGWWSGWLRRTLLPLTGTALAGLVLIMSLRDGSLPGVSVASLHEETESPLEETSAVTFRSESEKVTVVWLYDKDQASSEVVSDDVN